jgi:hypothetical protein
MSTMSRYNRFRVQRLREDGTDMPASPGSRGCDPGVLRHLLTMSCSNPRRDCISPGHCAPAAPPVRLCESTPASLAHVKSMGPPWGFQISAKIAAFQPMALSRNQHLPFTTASWLEARSGAFPPFFSQAPP